jgi:hypothetical protein
MRECLETWVLQARAGSVTVEADCARSPGQAPRDNRLLIPLQWMHGRDAVPNVLWLQWLVKQFGLESRPPDIGPATSVTLQALPDGVTQVEPSTGIDKPVT